MLNQSQTNLTMYMVYVVKDIAQVASITTKSNPFLISSFVRTLCAALHTGTLETVDVNKNQTCFLLSHFIMLSREAKIELFGFSKNLFLEL